MTNVRSSDPQPAHDAFEIIAPKISDMHRRLLAIVEREGIYGVTPWEIQCETGVIYNTVWRRLSELKEMGKIANTERSRPNDRGFDETVVVLRSLISDAEYIPPRGTKSRLIRENEELRVENEELRQLLAEVYNRWKGDTK